MSKQDPAEVLLKKLRRLESNMICPNCGTKAAQGIGFGSVCVKYKTFICDLCKTSHQAISHRVKSITMSTWTIDEVKQLTTDSLGGNEVALHVWLLNAPPFGQKYNGGSRPKQGDRIEIFKQFIVDCYESGKFKAATPFLSNSLSSPIDSAVNSKKTPSRSTSEPVKPKTIENFSKPIQHSNNSLIDLLDNDSFIPTEPTNPNGKSPIDSRAETPIRSNSDQTTTKSTSFLDLLDGNDFIETSTKSNIPISQSFPEVTSPQPIPSNNNSVFEFMNRTTSSPSTVVPIPLVPEVKSSKPSQPFDDIFGNDLLLPNNSNNSSYKQPIPIQTTQPISIQATPQKPIMNNIPITGNYGIPPMYPPSGYGYPPSMSPNMGIGIQSSSPIMGMTMSGKQSNSSNNISSMNTFVSNANSVVGLNNSIAANRKSMTNIPDAFDFISNEIKNLGK